MALGKGLHFVNHWQENSQRILSQMKKQKHQLFTLENNHPTKSRHVHICVEETTENKEQWSHKLSALKLLFLPEVHTAFGAATLFTSPQKWTLISKFWLFLSFQPECCHAKLYVRAAPSLWVIWRFRKLRGIVHQVSHLIFIMESPLRELTTRGTDTRSSKATPWKNRKCLFSQSLANFGPV